MKWANLWVTYLILYVQTSGAENLEISVAYNFHPQLGDGFDARKMKFTSENLFKQQLSPSYYTDNGVHKCSSHAFLVSESEDVYKHTSASSQIAVVVAYGGVEVHGSGNYLTRRLNNANKVSVSVEITCITIVRTLNSLESTKEKMAWGSGTGIQLADSTHFLKKIRFGRRCIKTFVHENREKLSKEKINAELDAFSKLVNSGIQSSYSGLHFTSGNSINYTSYDDCDVVLAFREIKTEQDLINWINDAQPKLLKTTEGDIGQPIDMYLEDTTSLKVFNPNIQLLNYTLLPNLLSKNLFTTHVKSTTCCNEIESFVNRVKQYQSTLPEPKVKTLTDFYNDVCVFVQNQNMIILDKIFDFMSFVITKNDVELEMNKINNKITPVCPDLTTEKSIEKRFWQLEQKITHIEDFRSHNISYVDLKNKFEVVKRSSREVYFLLISEKFETTDPHHFDFVKSWFLNNLKNYKRGIIDCDDEFDERLGLCDHVYNTTITKFVDGQEASSNFLCTLSHSTKEVYDRYKKNKHLGHKMIVFNKKGEEIDLGKLPRTCRTVHKTVLDKNGSKSKELFLVW